MKLELEPTGVIETVNGAPTRLWKGTSDKGVQVLCWMLVRVDIEGCGADRPRRRSGAEGVMKLELEPTGVIETVNGAPTRLWKGTSDKGVQVLCWMLVRVDIEHVPPALAEDFERELREVKPERQLRSI